MKKARFAQIILLLLVSATLADETGEAALKFNGVIYDEDSTQGYNFFS